MGKYFNTNEEFGQHSFSTIRIDDGDESNGWRIVRGGMIDVKGKLKQAEPIAWCATLEESQRLIKILDEIN